MCGERTQDKSRQVQGHKIGKQEAVQLEVIQLALKVQVRRKLCLARVRKEPVLNPDSLCSFCVVSGDSADTTSFC